MILGGLDKSQPEIASQIMDLTMGDSFPNALLFSGSSCSGRMFAARALVNQMGIPAENVIIISDRNHYYRIKTALELYRKNRNKAAKNFLKDNVGILLQQFHGALMDSQSPAGKKKFSDAAEISDLLRELDGIDENGADKFADKLEKALNPLMDTNRTVAISVGQVRSVRDWCSTSSMDGVQKMVIIEGLENASDSAINALLKTLEEPPTGTHFILISSNSGKIPATILSRVRKFRFKDIGSEEKKYILSSLFVNPNDYDSLEAFFLQGSGLNDKLLSDSAKALLMKQEVNMPELVRELESSQAWDRFFGLVIEEIQKAFQEGRLSQARAEYLLKAVNESVLKGRSFNQMKRLTFDYVVYRVQEVNR